MAYPPAPSEAVTALAVQPSQGEAPQPAEVVDAAARRYNPLPTLGTDLMAAGHRTRRRSHSRGRGGQRVRRPRLSRLQRLGDLARRLPRRRRWPGAVARLETRVRVRPLDADVVHVGRVGDNLRRARRRRRGAANGDPRPVAGDRSRRGRAIPAGPDFAPGFCVDRRAPPTDTKCSANGATLHRTARSHRVDDVVGEGLWVLDQPRTRRHGRRDRRVRSRGARVVGVGQRDHG